MTKDELKKEAEEESFKYVLDKSWACYVEKKQIMGHFSNGYLASAEPREKRIVELEKQLEELPDKWCRNKDDYCPHLAKLEQENAELKKQLDWKEKALAKAKKEVQRVADRVNKDKRRLIRRKQESADMLTKAKEIIREFVEWANWQGSNCPSFKSIQDKADQFLKDSEVEK